MANEQPEITEEDLIQEKMKDTRTAISEKIEKLEQKVVDTTVKAVSESVGTVLDTTNAVKETVDAVKDTVQQTVGSVKEFAQQGVESLKDAFDLRGHTRRHPWLVFGGAVAVGYCLEKWLIPHPPRPRKTALPPSSAGQPAKGTGTHRNGGHRASRESPSLVASWLGTLFQKFGPELEQFKGLALGVTLGLVRDIVANAMPESLRPQVTETFTRFADKMHVEITDLSTCGTPSATSAYQQRPAASPAAEAGRSAQWPERNLGRFDRP